MSLSDELNQLAELHSNGVLSEEEFSAAKSRLLAQGATQNHPDRTPLPPRKSRAKKVIISIALAVAVIWLAGPHLLQRYVDARYIGTYTKANGGSVKLYIAPNGDATLNGRAVTWTRVENGKVRLTGRDGSSFVLELDRDKRNGVFHSSLGQAIPKILGLGPIVAKPTR